MSLNRFENTLLDYLVDHPEEERFWRARVLTIDADGEPLENRAARLESELRDYAAERAQAHRRLAEPLGNGEIRLRNLAEYLLRTWTPPKPARRR